jgi:hypothetical protein
MSQLGGPPEAVVYRRETQGISMKIFRFAAVAALLTGPALLTGTVLSTGAAHAQMPNVNLIPELPSKTPEEKEQEEIQQKAYRDSLRKIPDAKVSSDPWGTVRSGDTPKETSKASAPAPAKRAKAGTAASKTGSAAN